jgi:hypothetical protein
MKKWTAAPFCCLQILKTNITFKTVSSAKKRRPPEKTTRVTISDWFVSAAKPSSAGVTRRQKVRLTFAALTQNASLHRRREETVSSVDTRNAFKRECLRTPF